jgi:hypothetical protein
VATRPVDDVNVCDNDIVVCRPAAEQHPRDKQIYYSRSQKTCSQGNNWKQQQRNGVFCAVVPIYCEDSWNNELDVKQSPTGKNVSTAGEHVVQTHDQVATAEDSKLRKLCVCCGYSDLWSV